MNQQQRKYLLDELKTNTNEKIRLLEELIPKKPSLQNYLLKAAMDGKLELQTEEIILAHIKDQATNLSGREKFLDISDEDDYNYRRRSRSGLSDPNITIPANWLFILPRDYKSVFSEYKRKKKVVEDRIEEVRAAQKQLEMRINLASDATLAPIIAEVDSMGKLSLDDPALKLLAPVSYQAKNNPTLLIEKENPQLTDGD